MEANICSYDLFICVRRSEIMAAIEQDEQERRLVYSQLGRLQAEMDRLECAEKVRSLDKTCI